MPTGCWSWSGRRGPGWRPAAPSRDRAGRGGRAAEPGAAAGRRAAGGRAGAEAGGGRDRLVSVHDPEMRHGRKSKSKRFDGHKAAVAVDTDEPVDHGGGRAAGNAPDRRAGAGAGGADRGDHRLCGRGEHRATSAYGDGETRQAFADAGRTLIAKVPGDRTRGASPRRPSRSTWRRGTCTCPGGQTTDDFKPGRTGGGPLPLRGGGVWGLSAPRPVRRGAAGGRVDRAPPGRVAPGGARLPGEPGVRGVAARAGRSSSIGSRAWSASRYRSRRRVTYNSRSDRMRVRHLRIGDFSRGRSEHRVKISATAIRSWTLGATCTSRIRRASGNAIQQDRDRRGALALAVAQEQDRAMKEQFAAPDDIAEDELRQWNAVLNANARMMVGRDPDA